jgi:hypothetical protein
VTGTADRRGPGGEAWPEEPQQQEDWGRPDPASYGGVPPQYGYQPNAPQPGYDTGQYPAQGYEGYDYGPPQQQYAEPGYGHQQYEPQQYQQQPYPYGYEEPQQYTDPYGQQAQPYSPPQQPVRQPPQQTPRQTSRPVPPAGPAAPGAQSSLPSEKVGYSNEEFTFVDDAEESADVIDWMKFSETRGERRDERRRKLRSRGIAAAVVLALALVGGAGYLWANGKLFASSPAVVAASTQRTVVAVHLHDLNKNVTTALLVSDPGAGKGSVLLLPGALGVPTDGGGPTVALASSVDAQGNAATRTALNTLLGTNVSATWALYTPFLQLLVDHLGGITLNADTTISQNGKNVVTAGQGTLNGTAAIAYATYQAKGESSGAQLARFGQVLAALVQAMPQDPTSASSDITSMGAVPDPSLPDATLGALLATLSKDAHGNTTTVQALPVKADGGLPSSAGSLVKQLLGGSVSGSGAGVTTAARVAVKDASGSANKANLANAAVINGGFTLVPGTAKAGTTQATTTISYTDDARAADAKALATDMGLPASVVRKVTSAQDADLLVVLGQDFQG